jgi:energy-coupling factor transport system permease protein
MGGGGPIARVRALADRLLVLLVSAVRRSERIALAMDARGFDVGGGRSRYRRIRVGSRDGVLIVGAVLVAVGAHAVA